MFAGCGVEGGVVKEAGVGLRREHWRNIARVHRIRSHVLFLIRR